uniref:Uncharacterized protein AlNc14C17G1792 n=1 Tax=Albugo laibachii Nc14 TaxID=890382 RepID=F0W4C1_9STRA|nr:conserved hypothetical protein [Albugo laibachii Nc14]|eukprot:CCA15954.1 conserved hypothetical protein [Albugo laibachii Nc14]
MGRPADPQRYLGNQQPGHNFPQSQLQRLYAAAIKDPQNGPHTQHEPLENVQIAVQHMEQIVRYPDARQKKLPIRMFDRSELYPGLGSGVLEWGRRFERQINVAQSACGFLWPEDVTVDLLGHYLQGMAERYYHKKLERWWNQIPTLQYAMEKMLEAFKTHITPAKSMRLFTRPKDPTRSWTEHFLYLVAVAEGSERAVDYLVLNNINDYLQQAEELAYFAQAWDTVTKKQMSRDVANVAREPRFRETRRCHDCGETIKYKDNFTLAISARGIDKRECWILDSGSSRHLCSDASWLEDVEYAKGVCIQPNGEELTTSKVGTVTLQVSAGGSLQTVKLTEVYFAAGLAHNLISDGQLDAKGFVLRRRGAQRVLETCDGKSLVFDVELAKNVLMVKAIVLRSLQLPRNAIMAAISGNAAQHDDITRVPQRGTLFDFHCRLGHLHYDTVERLAQADDSDFILTYRTHVKCWYALKARRVKTDNLLKILEKIPQLIESVVLFVRI